MQSRHGEVMLTLSDVKDSMLVRRLIERLVNIVLNKMLSLGDGSIVSEIDSVEIKNRRIRVGIGPTGELGILKSLLPLSHDLTFRYRSVGERMAYHRLRSLCHSRRRWSMGALWLLTTST